MIRHEVNEEWAHSGMVEAGEYCFLNYCVGNVGEPIQEQVDKAFEQMELRLKKAGLTLQNVVQMTCLFKNIWDIPVMEKVVKRRFKGKYPARKSLQTEFADDRGLLFQVDGIAWKGERSCESI